MKELLTIPGTELVHHMLFETNSVAVMLALMSGRWRRNNRVMSLLPSGIDATHHDKGNGSVTEANNCAVGTVAKQKQVACKSDFTSNNEFYKKTQQRLQSKQSPILAMPLMFRRARSVDGPERSDHNPSA